MDTRVEVVNREVASKLGHLFQEARKDRGLSLPQAEEAIRARFGADAISTSNLQRLEWGAVGKPAWIDVIRLAAFYGIPLVRLVEATGIPVAGADPDALTERQRQLLTLTEQMIQVASDDQLEYPITMNRLLLQHWVHGGGAPPWS